MRESIRVLDDHHDQRGHRDRGSGQYESWLEDARDPLTDAAQDARFGFTRANSAHHVRGDHWGHVGLGEAAQKLNRLQHLVDFSRTLTTRFEMCIDTCSGFVGEIAKRAAPLASARTAAAALRTAQRVIASMPLD